MKKKYPEFSVSYESYRTVFNNFFNISFGYPRTDTCSTCDRFTAEKRALDMKLEEKNIEQDERESLLKENRALDVSQKLHLKKQETFYVRKRKAKQTAKQCETKEAICIDLHETFLVPT